MSVLKKCSRAAYLLLAVIQLWHCAELKFPIPHEAAVSSDGLYHASYHPSESLLPSNFTIEPSLIIPLITINDVLPGTLYNIRLYYSNDSVHDQLIWTSDLPTPPDPPINLTVNVIGGEEAEVSWEAPRKGGYTGFKLFVAPLSEEDKNTVRKTYINHVTPLLLMDLTPGASYEFKVFSDFHGQQSSVFGSTNFTTKPNPPDRFIMCVRDETTLLVLWQPPYPSGIFDKYRVGIAPEDALESAREKEKDPPGPAQAAFYELVPGRNYNISVQTVSQNQISEALRTQYRTVPLPPTNVKYDSNSLTSFAFDLRWDPPKQISEFDRYRVAVGIPTTVQYTVNRDEERVVTFDGLDPGETYDVVVKTVSGKAQSWPVTANVTTRPLPVRIVSSSSENVGEIFLKWEPSRNSTQDSYRVKYSDMEGFNSSGSLLVVRNTNINLRDLLPGLNYSISVTAISKNIPSESTVVYQATNPSSPVIELLQPQEDSESSNLTWKSDVTSKQDQYAET